LPRALLSVSDKTGLVEFASELHSLGWELVSTGGTAKSLRAANLPVKDISEITGVPEMMDGIAPIDLIAVNLYPFRETAAKRGVKPADVIEQIDIGGPSMLRSAAKNFESVWVIVDPDDYRRVLAAIHAVDPDADLRRLLAGKVFSHTAGYDAAIASWFAIQREELFPETIVVCFDKAQGLRYGENPGQSAAFYVERAGHGLAGLQQRGGKELSFNNLLDLEGALLALDPFGGEIACAIIKHTTPCGLAVGTSALDAYKKALACDPVSAFGSVIGFNAPIDDETAETVSALFVECIVAPKFSAGAVEILSRKKNLRVLEGTAKWAQNNLDYKRVRGGVLVQERLPLAIDDANWRVVTKRQPTAEESRDVMFAWRAVASVKSNAIVLARGGATIGIGAGQMSRVDAAFLAVHKARQQGHDTAGSAMGSDAFFPFPDGVDQAADAGVTVIAQPGGSVKDAEVIAAADAHGIAMVFTGQRLFRH
jgi:phosphoribosylaminoimidazolecarboxamide formyltransferase/IMP cyclohydrolase